MEAAQAFFDGKYDTVIDEDDEMEDLNATRSSKRASGLEVSYPARSCGSLMNFPLP